MRLASALAIGAIFAAASPVAGARAQTVGPRVDAPRVSSGAAGGFSTHGSGGEGGWRGLIWPPMAGGAIDRFGLYRGEGLEGFNGQPLFAGRFGGQGLFNRLAEGRLTRDWPSAVRLKTGGFGFDVTPYAGIGASGDSHNAGALVRFGRGLGLNDGERGRRGKWFLFASADQETLGMNFLRNEDAWKRAGLGPDPGAMIGDTRAGLGWRDGPFQASVGYLYREIKPRDWDMIDAQTSRESLVAFRLSFHPGER